MNYLFNPLHPDAKGVEIEWCRWIKYDKRLFRMPETTDDGTDLEAIRCGHLAAKHNKQLSRRSILPQREYVVKSVTLH